MTSQITKDFQMKSKLRKLADGGSPNPSMLGTGAAARAGGLLAGRGRQIDDAVDAATGSPAPAPAPAPQQAAQAPKKSGLRSMLGLADGGSYLNDGYNANRHQQSQLKDGGRVKGPGGRTDDKVGPVMLSDEEYVLPGDTADAIGRDKLDAIRLATHDFKDERKESALRGRTDDVPVDHLADGGNPWIADDKGNVRKPNAFGDAAAGPGYQQPRLPPPQPGTAVGPSAISPGGPRTINMGMAEDVTPRPAQIANNPTMPTAAKTAQPWTGAPPTNPNVGPGGSREAQAFRNAAGNPFGDAAAASKDASLSRIGSGARSLLNVGGKLGAVGLAGAGIAGGMEPDSTDRYAERFGVSPPTGDGSLGDLVKFSALRAGGFASDMGSALTFGLADKLYRDKQAVDTNMMASSAGAVGGGVFGKGVGNVVGGALDAGAGLVSRGRYKGNAFSKALGGLGGVVGTGAGLYAGKALSDAGGDGGAGGPVAGGPVAGAGAPAAAASPTSALRSDQGPAQPVAPGSYQSRRLSEMGVPLDVQNSKPVVDSVNSNTRDFLRTGGTSQFQNLGTYGGNGNIYGKADDPSRPGRINNFVGVGAGASPENEANGSGSGGYAGRGGVPQSSLRGSSAPSGGSSVPGVDAAAKAINDRYDRMLKEGRGRNVEFGADWSQRHGIDLETARGRELNGLLGNARTNETSRANAQLSADTSRSNAELSARTSMLQTLGQMGNNRATLGAQAQAAQLKALQDAQKVAREGEEKGFDRYTGAIGQMFTVEGKDGKQTVDKAAQERFRSFIEGSDPKAGEKFASMAPQQQQVLLQNFKTLYDMNEVRNKTAQSGSWPSNTGGVTNRMDMPVDTREATVDDWLSNNLPLKDYIWSNLPGTNPNVVVTESGQPTLYSDYTSTGGERDLDKEKIVRDSVSARRSALRSN